MYANTSLHYTLLHITPLFAEYATASTFDLLLAEAGVTLDAMSVLSSSNVLQDSSNTNYTYGTVGVYEESVGSVGNDSVGDVGGGSVGNGSVGSVEGDVYGTSSANGVVYNDVDIVRLIHTAQGGTTSSGEKKKKTKSTTNTNTTTNNTTSTSSTTKHKKKKKHSDGEQDSRVAELVGSIKLKNNVNNNVNTTSGGTNTTTSPTKKHTTTNSTSSKNNASEYSMNFDSVQHSVVSERIASIMLDNNNSVGGGSVSSVADGSLSRLSGMYYSVYVYILLVFVQAIHVATWFVLHVCSIVHVYSYHTHFIFVYCCILHSGQQQTDSSRRTCYGLHHTSY